MGVRYQGKGSRKKKKEERKGCTWKTKQEAALGAHFRGFFPVGHFKSSVRLGLCCVELYNGTVLPSPCTASSQAFPVNAFQ